MLYKAGSLINARERLWRVDMQEGNLLHVSALDEVEEKAQRFISGENSYG